MKKLISILLLAAMLLSLTACGAAGKTDDAAKKIEEAVAAAAEAAAEETPAPAEEPAPEEELAPTEEPAPMEEDPDAEAFIGVKIGNSYSNKTLGLRAEFPDTWVILDDEQTAQVIGLVADSFSEADLVAILRESGVLYDLYAMALDQSGDTVNVVIQDIGVLYGVVLDEDKYLDLSEEALETTLTQMGMTNVRVDRERRSFAGQEHVFNLVSAEFNGVQIYECQILCKVGSYMSVVTVSSLNQAHLDEILGFFSAYEG